MKHNARLTGAKCLAKIRNEVTQAKLFASLLRRLLYAYTRSPSAMLTGRTFCEPTIQLLDRDIFAVFKLCQIFTTLGATNEIVNLKMMQNSKSKA